MDAASMVAIARCEYVCHESDMAWRMKSKQVLAYKLEVHYRIWLFTCMLKARRRRAYGKHTLKRQESLYEQQQAS